MSRKKVDKIETKDKKFRNVYNLLGKNLLVDFNSAMKTTRFIRLKWLCRNLKIQHGSASIQS